MTMTKAEDRQTERTREAEKLALYHDTIFLCVCLFNFFMPLYNALFLVSALGGGFYML